MGNHEYCSECGQSDFHMGQTCEQAYPLEYRQHQKYLRSLDKRKMAADDAAKKMVSHLQQQNIPAAIGTHGNVVISKWDLIKDLP